MKDTPTLSANGLSEVETKKHLGTIELLTQQSGHPKVEVQKRYEAELALADSVRIREFLPILIGRKVKQALLSSN